LLAEAAGSTADTLSDEIEAVTLRYSGLPAVGDAEYGAKIKVLAEDGLATDDLSCFLTVSRAKGQSPVVSVVLGLTRYSAGMGGSTALQGRIVGFLGEVIGDQLPTMVVMPETNGHTMVDCVELDDYDVPPVAAIEAAFTGNAPPAVIEVPVGATRSALPRMMFISKAWAVYFLDRKTPYQAFKAMEALMATLPIQAQRDKALPLMEWAKAVCIREGGGVDERRASQSEVPWETPDLVDRRLILWATRQLAPYRAPVPVVPAAVMQGFQMGAVPPYVAPAAVGTKNYTAMEHDKIRGACTLSAADYDVYVPPIFAEILTEGRTVERVQAVLQVRLKPDQNADHPVYIHVSRDMAQDVKELRFGYGGDKDYASCHRGISPFAVVPVSAEAASMHRRAQDRLSRVSHLTSADAREMETSPGLCPTTYDALLRVLLCYITFLKLLCGGYCAHYLEVVAIRRTLSRKVNEYSSMTPAEVAGILWAIFCDARNFFSEPAVGDELPESMLLSTRVWLETECLKIPNSAPIGRLLGFAREGPTLSQPAGQSAGGGMRAESLFGGGGTTQSPTAAASVKGPPWVNPSPNAAILLALKPAITKDPKVKIVDLMNAGQNRIRYRELRVGISGTCLDLAFMGICKSHGCTYSHVPQGAIAAATATKKAAQLKKMVVTFVGQP
jgi:hypothetical protein